MLYIPEEAGCTWIYVLGICVQCLLDWVTVSFVETWEIIFFPHILLPWPSGTGEAKKPPGWPWRRLFWVSIFLYISPVQCCLCFMLSCIYSPTTFKCFLFPSCLIFFLFFSFSSSLSQEWHTLCTLSFQQLFADKNNTFTSQGTKWEKNEEQY